MLDRRSNRLKTWRHSHVNRLQIGRQRRVGSPGWPEPFYPLLPWSDAFDRILHGDSLARRLQPVLTLSSLAVIVY